MFFCNILEQMQYNYLVCRSFHNKISFFGKVIFRPSDYIDIHTCIFRKRVPVYVFLIKKRLRSAEPFFYKSRLTYLPLERLLEVIIPVSGE